MTTENESLKQLILADPDIMMILKIIRSLSLADSWLCAGTIRNFIWNHLSNKPRFDTTTDVDVVFFDSSINYQQTLLLEKQLKIAFSQYQWELKNQVDMHLHSPDTLPYTSSKDAIAKFPETATAIGLRLNLDDELELYAPFGLSDAYHFQVVPTPHFLENEARLAVFKQRVLGKNWQKKWPQLHYPANIN